MVGYTIFYDCYMQHILKMVTVGFDSVFLPSVEVLYI